MSRLSIAVLALLIAIAAAEAGGTPDKSKAVNQNAEGKYADKAGTPTYDIKPDGTVDWYTSTIRTAMSAMDPTRPARPMRRRWPTRSRP